MNVPVGNARFFRRSGIDFQAGLPRHPPLVETQNLSGIAPGRRCYCLVWLSSKAFKRAKSLRLARRIAAAMNGENKREKPAGEPRF